MPPFRHFHRLAWIATLLALLVVLFGILARLSGAGLAAPGASMPEPVWSQRAHDALLAVVVMLAWGLAWLGSRNSNIGRSLVAAAGLLVLYVVWGNPADGGLIFAVAALALLGWALRPVRSGARRGDFSRLSALVFAVVAGQAALNAWIMTAAVGPVVAGARLPAGMASMGLLAWMACRASPQAALHDLEVWSLRWPLALGVAGLCLEIVLGAGVSASQAGLACGVDFPTCRGRWWPQQELAAALAAWREGTGGGFGSADSPARVAMHFLHRLFALVLALGLLGVVRRVRRVPVVSGWGTTVLVLLVLTLVMGVLSVTAGLPRLVSLTHSVAATLLLFVLLVLLARLRRPPCPRGAQAERALD